MIEMAMRVSGLMWLVIISIAVSLMPASGQQPGSVPLTVCDVLADPPKYRNKVVEINAEFRAGRHAVDLFSKNCKFHKPRRLAAICITAAGDLDAPKVQFNTNPVLESVIAVQRMAGDLDIGFRGSAVLEGQLFFEDERRGVGFCSTNSYPVLMVVKDVKRYCLWRDDRSKPEGNQARGRDDRAESSPVLNCSGLSSER